MHAGQATRRPPDFCRRSADDPGLSLSQAVRVGSAFVRRGVSASGGGKRSAELLCVRTRAKDPCFICLRALPDLSVLGGRELLTCLPVDGA